MEFSLDDTKEKTSDTTENTDATEDDNIEVDKDNTKDENNEKTEEDNAPTYNYEPDIKNGKIRCRYCGKYNKEKRTYCYLCAKKLKD